MNKDQLKHIKELAEPIVLQEDLYIVDLEAKSDKESTLWLYVDSEAADVSIDACSRISRELGYVLDAHDLIPSRYRLNVSSPGLTRPLSDRRQYLKNRGRETHVKYKTSEGYHKLKGVLKDVSSDKIEVEIEDGENELISFESIIETKIIPTFTR